MFRSSGVTSIQYKIHIQDKLEGFTFDVNHFRYLMEENLAEWEYPLLTGFSTQWYFTSSNGTEEDVPMRPKYLHENRNFINWIYLFHQIIETNVSVSQLSRVVKKQKVLWIAQYHNLEDIKRKFCKHGMLHELKQDEIIAGIMDSLEIPINISTNTPAKKTRSEKLMRQGFEMFVDIIHCPNPELASWQQVYKKLFKSSPPRSILQTLVNLLKNPAIGKTLGADINHQLFSRLYKIMDLKVGMVEVLLGSKSRLSKQGLPFSDEERACIDQDDCKSLDKIITKQGEVL